MKRSSRLAAMGGLILFFLLAFGLDFWKVEGTVLDIESGNAVSESRVLITFRAEELRSPIPHAWTSKTRCVGALIRTSDADGRFRVWLVSWGLGLTNKKVAIDVFKPGWYGNNHLFRDANTRPLARSLKLIAHIRNGADTRRVDDNQRVSPLLADPASLGRHMSSSCRASGEAAVIEGLEYAAALAKTPREIRLVRLRCQEQLNRSLLRRGVMIGTQRPLPSPWPDDVAPACEALLRDPPR
jgi:hypothetical protein